VEVVASLSQGRTAAAKCGLFTHKSVPVIFEPPCSIKMGTRIRWPRTGRDQYWDLITNLQIRETTRNLWHNRVQSAQDCYLLLQFNINVMIYPLFKVKRKFCASESGSPRFGTGFWYRDVISQLHSESFSECWHNISASFLFH